MSVSIISAAASQRRMAASPRVRCPLPGSARAEGRLSKTAAPAVTAAPATMPFFRNDRRLAALVAREEMSSLEAEVAFEAVKSAGVLVFIEISVPFADGDL